MFSGFLVFTYSLNSDIVIFFVLIMSCADFLFTLLAAKLLQPYDLALNHNKDKHTYLTDSYFMKMIFRRLFISLQKAGLYILLILHIHAIKSSQP